MSAEKKNRVSRLVKILLLLAALMVSVFVTFDYPPSLIKLISGPAIVFLTYWLGITIFTSDTADTIIKVIIAVALLVGALSVSHDYGKQNDARCHGPYRVVSDIGCM